MYIKHNKHNKKYYFDHNLLKIINYPINYKYTLYEIWLGCYKICIKYYISKNNKYGNLNPGYINNEAKINSFINNSSNIYLSNVYNITSSNLNSVHIYNNISNEGNISINVGNINTSITNNNEGNITATIYNNITDAISTGNIYHTNLINNQSNNYYNQDTTNNDYLEVKLPIINDPKYISPELKLKLNVYKLSSYNKMIDILKKHIINDPNGYIILNDIPIDNLDNSSCLAHNVNIII